MKNNKFVCHRYNTVTFITLLFLLASCGANSDSSEGLSGAHGATKKRGGLFSLFDNGLRLGKKAYDGALNGIDMLKARIKGEGGTWTPELSQIAKSEVESHPNLIQGINGQNPLRGICDNYLSMSPASRVNVMIAVAASVAYGEGHFGTSGTGGERSNYRRSRGRFQISKGAEGWGCWTSGYRPYNDQANLDCVYKMMDGQFQQGKPVANNKSYWSVLRPNMYLESRFMSSFSKLAPQCEKDYKWSRSRAYPGPEVLDQQIPPSDTDKVEGRLS